MTYELTIATFVLVYGRAIQQLNVVGGHYISAAITPFFIACGEVATVLFVVSSGWQSIPWIGLGGAIGATLAMYSHSKFFKKIGLKK